MLFFWTKTTIFFFFIQFWYLIHLEVIFDRFHVRKFTNKNALIWLAKAIIPGREIGLAGYSGPNQSDPSQAISGKRNQLTFSRT